MFVIARCHLCKKQAGAYKSSRYVLLGPGAVPTVKKSSRASFRRASGSFRVSSSTLAMVWVYRKGGGRKYFDFEF